MFGLFNNLDLSQLGGGAQGDPRLQHALGRVQMALDRSGTYGQQQQPRSMFDQQPSFDHIIAQPTQGRVAPQIPQYANTLFPVRGYESYSPVMSGDNSLFSQKPPKILPR